MEVTIRRRLATDEQLCTLLASNELEPAIYYQKAPDDTDVEENFPRVVFSVDKFSDAQKGVAGLLSVDIFSLRTKIAPDEIERILRGRLEGVFFKPQLGEIFSVKWQRSDIFSEPASERIPLVDGVAMTFEIYEFPRTETNAPDPIKTLNTWAEKFDGLMIIGRHDFKEFFVPTAEKPAIYFDAERIRLIEQKGMVSDVEATINLHLFAPDVRTRRQWLDSLNQEILMTPRFFMDDGSPMHLKDAEYLWTASETQGQIQLKFKYGILPRPYLAPPLNHLLWRTGHVHD